MTRSVVLSATMTLLAVLCGAQPALKVRTTFRIRYVTLDSVYIEGGRDAGMAEGMRLVVVNSPSSASDNGIPTEEADTPVIAQLKVVSVAATSAVCEIVSSSRTLVVGDVARLTSEDVSTLIAKRTLSNTRAYPAIVSFSEGDPLDEEVREQVPRPPLPEVNRARGRIGIDYSGTFSGGPVRAGSSQVGLVLRTDITRIAGTYWNISGYWRGRITSRSTAGRDTLQDLINRTYHLSATYMNPSSKWVAGVGRMYLPWASSLETIDGGYIGLRVARKAVLGSFAGSTPDPTSWRYNPDRRIAGSFLNVEGGDYEKVHYTTTFGAGVSAIRWRIERPFVFAESSVSYGRILSVYDSIQIDRPRIPQGVAAVGTGVSQSFVSVRLQPHKRLAFDVNHSFFRDIPTYDPQLVGTGLLDRLLFQGFSGGARVDLPKRLTFYSSVGRSSKSGDTRSSWNNMFGVTLGSLWKTGLRLDARYSKFDSVFARGAYRSFSISRNFSDECRLDVQFGKQSFVSPLTRDSGSRFVTGSLDYSFGPHYFVQSGVTLQRGTLQRYNQYYSTFGYRFDNRSRTRRSQ